MALEAQLNKTTSATLTTGNIVHVHPKSGQDIVWMDITCTVDALVYVYPVGATLPADGAATPANLGKPLAARATFAHRVDAGTVFVEGETAEGVVGVLGTDR